MQCTSKLQKCLPLNLYNISYILTLKTQRYFEYKKYFLIMEKTNEN